MTKQTTIIIAIISGLLILGLGFFLILRSDKETPAAEEGQAPSFPIGEEMVFPATGGETGEPTIIEYGGLVEGELSSALIQLTDFAVSGAVFEPETEKIRYIEKSTGHVYEIGANGQNKKQLTITTIPGIYSVDWSKDAARAILKYFDSETETARTFLGSFMATSTEGVFLPSSTTDAAASPSENNKLFYLMNGEYGAGIISTFENKNINEVFSSAFSEFIIDWPQTNTITLLTKPSASAQGYLYKIDPRYKSFTKILGEIKGLTALYSPTNDRIIYSESRNKSINTKIYDTKNQTAASLGITTLPEKCVFSKTDENKIYCAVPISMPSAKYPDEWYQGLISFSDNLWQINVNTGIAKIIFYKSDFDITNLFTDKNENYLFFTNKKDSTLWSLQISND